MVFNSKQTRANRTRLEALLRQFEILEFNAKAAIEFGKLRADLRKQGRPIPVFDILIAAIVRANNMTLLSADHHFEMIDGLTVENWLV